MAMQTAPSERIQKRIEAVHNSLPKDKGKEYYEGMLFGYRSAVIAMHGGVDTFVRDETVWDQITITALAIERKMKETK